MSRDFSLPPVQATSTGFLNPAEDCHILYERRLAPRSVVVVARFGAELIISQPHRQMRWQCADNVRGRKREAAHQTAEQLHQQYVTYSNI